MSKPIYRGPRVTDTKSFIEKARFVHGDKFDYSQSIYSKAKDKIQIICPTHGPFHQEASSHVNGRKGCLKCAKDDAASHYRLDLSNFIARSVEKHGEKYDYSNVDYKNARTKVKILCPIHGHFLQEPWSHMIGCGCPKCNKTGSFTYKTVKRNPNKRITRYVIRLSGNGELFYKVGLATDTSIRFKSIPSMYEIEVLDLEETTLEKAFLQEQTILSEQKPYSPKIKFGGHTECFTL